MNQQGFSVEHIFALDRQHLPPERYLPWRETRSGLSVVVEPKPHWAMDLLAFSLSERRYCYYADWCHNGPNARFFDHIEKSGADVLEKAHTMIADELSQGLWDRAA
ncbi:hypothetical protein CFBP4996_26450 (plasmid) [Agrobacterium leguminum]|uniref:hypothetical protein n=1 Tax=Agrobacterium leguminum TaxID=2792015 RepID=UPI0010C97831|nr:hypothetical protein [Agrobacterium leguminum]WFS69536.1 hypothetical protein CFBP4996_26450 [Agrobacterium leguminum]